MRKPWQKMLVLASSVSLVILFLLYRAGSFDRYLQPDNNMQSSPNGGPFNTAARTDTTILPKKDTTPLILPSSKSGIIVDKKPLQPAFPDTIFTKPAAKDTTPPKPTRILSSSKSVIIIDQQKFRVQQPDTTIKKKKKH